MDETNDIILLSSSEDEFEKNINESCIKLNESNIDTYDDNSNSLPRHIDSKKLKPKRECVYEAVEWNPKLEKEIEKLKIIGDLTPKQIEYMVLRDVNYFIDIFSGNCDHSWRHEEYKKFSKKSGNLLYENSAMTSYTYDQYMSAVKALQSVFCKKNNKYDEYIVKVLLPEALIKICMRVYQCSKGSAEEFLQKNNIKKCFKEYPKGSVIFSSTK
ncbi:unnamed protein product [Brachionus calyciflorus]|uniref:Uncharacterized protein n=1 Tax=Brachionus calyciflorus TaxID=104777 RepID=A0A813P3G1_9BILA|nr:unnamed protein product [Brachionus calyciflorus]